MGKRLPSEHPLKCHRDFFSKGGNYLREGGDEKITFNSSL
jgi:hypothetical protein